MRNTKVPDDAPPLIERSSAARYGSAAGGFPGVAAKLSLCAGLFSFLLNHHAASPQARLSPEALQGVILVCVLLIIAGLALALFALISNRKTGRPGVTGFAVAGFLVNGLLIAINAYYYIRVATHREP